MTTFNELLPVPSAVKVQIWVIGTREQVKHTINEFYVKQLVSDYPTEGTASHRVHFMPIVSAPFAQGRQVYDSVGAIGDEEH